jgi:hypothetical protein
MVLSGTHHVFFAKQLAEKEKKKKERKKGSVFFGANKQSTKTHPHKSLSFWRL